MLCICVILAAYTALIFPSLVLELRWTQFQGPDQPHVHWSIAHFPSSLLPIRACNDSDPVRSWSNSSNQSPVGCSNSLLSGSYFGTMRMGTLSPMIFHTSARAALAACLLLSLLLLAACVAAGTQPAAFGFPQESPSPLSSPRASSPPSSATAATAGRAPSSPSTRGSATPRSRMATSSTRSSPAT
jgi:hypothetical protein